MSAAQNLSYSVIQVVHNFGAVATVGGSVIASRLSDNATRRRLGWVVLCSWVIQAGSGALFGIVTYHFYKQLPEISGLALNALIIKMICVSLAVLMLVIYQWQSDRWSKRGKDLAWISSSILAFIAISAAAFLRWFS